MLLKELLQWAQGNLGAGAFLKLLTEPENVAILQKLEEAKSIRGSNLYILWSDLCDRDLAKVETLCKKCPTAVLEDACNRQDFTGRKLVAEYVA